MSSRAARALAALGLVAGGACGDSRPAGEAPASAEAARTTVEGAGESDAAVHLAAYDLASPPATRVSLPAELHEISGLAVTPDGRVFAHGDEEATVYQLDPRSGHVVKRFSLAATGDDPDLGKKGGKGGLAGDFEDLAIVRDRFFLMSSNGVVLEFPEGEDGASVPYEAYDTGLGKVCELEGLAHDSATESLLLLCKTMEEKSERQQVVIYTWSLAGRTVDEQPRVKVPWSALAPVTGAKGFNGSALALVPGGKSLLVVAGPQRLYAEIALDGTPLQGGALDRGTHSQPESLAFLPDGSLLVGSEGGKGDAVLARYPAGPAR